MEIRPYKVCDQSTVVELWTQSGLVSENNDPIKDIERKLKVDPDLFLVGVQDAKVVATVMGGYEGHRGWINYLAVAPCVRRKGYARALMQTVEELIRAKGCPKINLQVRDTNTEVLAFYAAIGYADDHVLGLGKRFDFD